ncbi:type II toxin-antitoxin system PemI/MazE family antitoxin [Xylocopilactobacillus apis]|uniref:Uncharacterized protein n=1 Tax=Xylocopilactobacillus apis TaxID=2932183 RepID=A0AAU9D3V2_9LACO|nr:AbrB family transcriptional regulator [Xylocopilactobacillus apis]BDR57020.1 hypothetical protein KIMC2_15820 [Xylocopilactobacillus apis]
MKKVKAKKYGDSIIISLTNDLNIKPNQEFFLSKDEMGFITLIPVLSDLYSNVRSPNFEGIDSI